MSNVSRCGFVAIVGCPNVGKSSLLNRILGYKVSITSRKAQTTKHQILGIKTDADSQTIYVDTPGINLSRKLAIHRYLYQTALAALEGVDLVLFMVSGTRLSPEEETILALLKQSKSPVFLVINKIDLTKDKDSLLPFIEKLTKQFSFAEVIPVSARTGENVDRLQEVIKQYLPEHQFVYDPDQITDRSEHFLVSEIIREKAMRLLGEEVPHALAIEIENFKTEPKLVRIDAIIWVEREGQKAIIIGKGGLQLKEIGRAARVDMEKLLDQKVMLRLWVKVKKGWSDDQRILRKFGFSNE